MGGVDIPVVSVELTTTTPQSQHAKQRMPRVIAAAEADIPAIYIIPARKLSGGSNYTLGNDLYWGMRKVRTINNVPVFIYAWPDNNGVLENDLNFPGQPPLSSSNIQFAINIIKELIAHKASGHPFGTIFGNPIISAEIEKQDAIAMRAEVEIANYTTLTSIDTVHMAQFLMDNTEISHNKIRDTIARLPKRIAAREKTLIFRPAGRLFEHANDPYSGMLSFFDYAFCRFGRGVEERFSNLIYMPVNPAIDNITDEFSVKGYHAYWENKCPFRNPGVPTVDAQFNISHHLQYGCVFTKNKPMRILGYFSDLLVFQDSMLVF